MKFLPLLGKRLKDDEVIDLLDEKDIQVIYDFDRLHENMPDKYWATSQSDGFELCFDADQILSVIFLYATPADGFTAVGQADDVHFFSTLQQAEAHAAQQNIHLSKGEADFMGAKRHWLRLEYHAHSVHYEFRDGHLARVTLTNKQ